MLIFNPFTGGFDYAGTAGGGVSGVSSVNGKTGAVTLTSTDVGLGNCNNTSDANKPISTATATALGLKADLVGGIIPTSQIPAIAISDFLGNVANQTAMLAAVGEKGDWVIRSDTGSTWIITGTDPTLLANWTSISYPTSPVTSVNGKTGGVVLGFGDVGAQQADATLAALAAVTTSTNQLIYATGPDTFATTGFTAFGRSLVDDADATTAQTTLGLGTLATQSGTFADTASAISNTIFVDKNGNDGTGARGKPGKPFLTILAAKAATGITAGDVIVVGPGTFVESGKIQMPSGVSLRGSGMGVTVIQCAIGGTILAPGSNSIIADLTVQATVLASFQFPIGADATENAFTNVVVARCKFIGGTDCVYVNQTSAGTDSITFYDCTFLSQWDTVYCGESGGAMKFYNCDFISTGGNANALNTSRSINISAGTFKMFGGTITTSGGSSTNHAIEALGANSPVVELHNVVISATGTAALDLSQSSTGAIKIDNVSRADGAALVTSGTITPLSRNLSREGGTMTGLLTLRAGTTAANTAPLKFVNGPLNTSQEEGALEFNANTLYFTITTGPTRRAIVMSPAAGPVTIAGTTGGRVMTVPDANFTAARTDAGNGFAGQQTITDTNEYPLSVNNNTITANQGIASFLSSNLADGSSIFFVLGKAITATNCATFSFTRNATATSNRWSVGFYALDNLFNVFQSGGASLGAPGTTTDPGAGVFNLTSLVASGSVKIGGGTPILKVLSATATLDFASTNAQNSRDLTITVTGAAVGDVVALGIPVSLLPANSNFSAWVSAADTVTVRFNNYSSIALDPSSGTYRVMVTQF